MYRLITLTLSTFLASSITLAAALPDTTCKGPGIVKILSDFDIIADNTAIIEAKNAFVGDALSYSVDANPLNKINTVTIDAKTGTIHIQAAKRDHFDVKVSAKNKCGTAYTQFNVVIDEEE
ncbi:MAG: hypothetical protein P4M12_07360 [Gammaproteobacteria bacterium]|nr:hypothetical protein [Gammaproteobacteria bacterium]